MSLSIQLLALEGATALGTLSETETAMDAGRSALTPLGDVGYPDRLGARLADIDDFEDDPALRILGRHGRALEPVLRAAHGAGHGPQVARERLGLFLALGMVDAEPSDLSAAVHAARDATGAFDLGRFFSGAFRSIHPLWPLSMLNNVAAGQFAIDLDIRGDNLVVASDADSGVRALLEAARSIQAGHADAALVAGASEAISPFSMARFALEGRTGHTPGEAAGAWVLASPACANSLGAVVRGVLRGGATAFGARPGGGGPSREAYTRALGQALEAGQLDAASIDLVVSDPDDHEAAAAARTACRAPHWSASGSVGALGPAEAFVEGALALRRLRSSAAGSTILLLTGGATGSAGALVLEAV